MGMTFSIAELLDEGRKDGELLRAEMITCSAILTDC